MMTLDQMIEVMTAAKNGKRIEFRNPHDLGDGWEDNEAPGWNWQMFEYRVKHEPMEIVVAINPSTGEFCDPRKYYPIEGCVRKKFREVVEE